MFRLILLVVLFPFFAQAVEFKEGDIIFQETDQRLKILTRSRWTHVGVILKEGTSLVVAQAGPGVVKTPLNTFIQNGINQDYVVKRLDEQVAPLNDNQIASLKQAINAHIGKRYDFWFEWSDDVIYCSELVWKVFAQALSQHQNVA